MASWRRQRGTEQGGRLWPLLLGLLAAVLVPAACVLVFMDAAMRNVQSAVRQNLTEVYRRHALAGQGGIDAFWSARTALERGPEPAPQAFARLVQTGLADSVVIAARDGQEGYPAVGVAQASQPTIQPADFPAWQQAEHMEFQAGEPGKAAEAYAHIAATNEDTTVQARALAAQVRCLVEAGRKDQAVQLVTGPLAQDKYRDVADADGRLIAPGRQLLALQLLGDPNTPESRSLAMSLAERLNDYDAPMPSPQRRFLMRSLQELAGDLLAPNIPQRGVPPAPLAFPTLAAEELAGQYLDRPQPAAQDGVLARTADAGVWQMPVHDGQVILLLEQDKLLPALRAAAKMDDPLAGILVALLPPGPQGRKEAFLTVPASRHMPGWDLAVTLVDDPFGDAIGRQNSLYLATGLTGIAVIAVLATAVAGYVGRQMKLTRLKNDLIATVSHELKTPLASMRVFVDTLAEGRYRDPGQAREYLGLIAKENERLTRLIDNFLTFSRMERNKRVFQYSRLAVGPVIQAAVESVRERFDRPGCRLEVQVPGDLPSVVADRDALVTVLVNLLDNAQKYTGQAKLVTLKAWSDGPAGSVVCLSVTDNGIGLSRRETRRVFDRFYQVDRSLSRRAGGCGLGLSIVKFILDAHGAAIDVTSQPGKGSTFTVRLPAEAKAGQETDRHG